ncbi:5-carboxymethyl-2-hydroxymuconate Delta-isomerase [Pseudaestuariivita atlantica]|uniref:5-carboxymethyl-2-hydroxymuconate isomerase n=1 Tax=Pseudaestuariivita atlantica TaxID=1317121 RepID=A0A0L1JT44_9RHOB|nr:5-carboxymethyl-2-hydroxymuconate Delta-isomerase [Pseudaestuariivita atlantica]KNG94887.1 5-carboxymethyl-2-hydroxymuconate isomerase [Pseudaestuariivita atlantica]
MPHLTLEYSPNLEPEVDMTALCDALREAMIETGVFPMPGIRVRAYPATHMSVADGDPKHAFIDMSLRLRAGRSDADKHRATDHVFDAARAFLAPVMERRSLALSFEMRDINPDLSRKTGTIRDHLKDPANG